MFQESQPKIISGQYSEMSPTGRAAVQPIISDQNFYVENQQPEMEDEDPANLYGALNSSKMSQNINDDSLTLRKQRDSYLKQFNDNRSGKGGSPNDINIGNLNVSSGPNLAMDRSPQ